MFREKPEENFNESLSTSSSAETTVLNEDAQFEGKLTFEGTVTINGNFKGEVVSSGELIIGKNGSLTGNVQIGKITIYGKVDGNIKAKQKIVINDPAIVRGDIVAPSLIIEEGSVFEGNCAMGNYDKVVQIANSSNDD